MRIEVQVPMGTDPLTFDDILSKASPEGYVLLRRSSLPVGFTETIVIDRTQGTNGRTGPYIALSAELYELKEGETS